jgi:hypothetical protein
VRLPCSTVVDGRLNPSPAGLWRCLRRLAVLLSWLCVCLADMDIVMVSGMRCLSLPPWGGDLDEAVQDTFTPCRGGVLTISGPGPDSVPERHTGDAEVPGRRGRQKELPAPGDEWKRSDSQGTTLQAWSTGSASAIRNGSEGETLPTCAAPFAEGRTPGVKDTYSF